MDAVKAGTSFSVVLILLILGVIVTIGIIGLIIAIVAGSKKEILTAEGEDSYFDGNTFQLLAYRILCGFVSAITFGIAYPWMICLLQSWETSHTVINGRRLKFTGQGHQLIGRYLLWVLLTYITCGIYSIWLGLGIKKWIVKHTVYADETEPVESYFSGGAGGYLGVHIIHFMLTVITFGIGKAWADKILIKWEAQHTHIGGSPLNFNGTGGQLFVKYFLLGLLTPITLGIYALFFPVIYKKWEIMNTEAVYKSEPIKRKAREQELEATQDFAKYRIAANDQEIAAVKSGFTGNENDDTLEEMAKNGNYFAAYHLAKKLKGDDVFFSGKSLELLQTAVNSNYHPALLDYSKQLPSAQALSALTFAAQNGNDEASWLLANEYKKSGDLVKSAYWFKVALEWNIPGAVNNANQYEKLITDIQLQLAEGTPTPKNNTALAVILAIIGTLIILGIGAGVLIFIPSTLGIARQDEFAFEVAYVDLVDVDDIQGETFNKTDVYGNDIEYVLDESAFYDKDEGIIYLQFGVVDYDYNVKLRFNNDYTTQPISSGKGITEIPYHYVDSPARVSIVADDGPAVDSVITSHDIDVTEGSTYDANVWLGDKYGVATDIDESPQEVESSTQSVVSSPSDSINSQLIGKWEFRDYYTNMETGDNGFDYYDIVLNADGTYSMGDGKFIETDRVTDEYINGIYWEQVGGSGISGTYAVSGNTLILKPNESWAIQYGQEGIIAKSYTFTVNGNALTLEGGSLRWPREYTKAQ